MTPINPQEKYKATPPPSPLSMEIPALTRTCKCENYLKYKQEMSSVWKCEHSVSSHSLRNRIPSN